MINRKQRNIIWEKDLKNKLNSDLTIGLLKDNTNNFNKDLFISKNLVSRLVKSIPSFGGTIHVTTTNKEKGTKFTGSDLRNVVNSQITALGVVIRSNENEEYFISTTELKDLLKQIPESPYIESMSLKKELILNLMCVLSWREVELVSESEPKTKVTMDMEVK